MLCDQFDTLDEADNENLVGITRAVVRITAATAGTSDAGAPPP
ncbi:MAG TPA: hypothetical protein VFR26_08120 [Acidimicrobiales bacterium]|nr:hypothetical protein [Acidimicrobiales bacterium]